MTHALQIITDVFIWVTLFILYNVYLGQFMAATNWGQYLGGFDIHTNM